MAHYDALETRDAEARDRDLATALPAAIRRAKAAPALAEALAEVDPDRVTDRAALARLPVIRKADLSAAQ